MKAFIPFSIILLIFLTGCNNKVSENNENSSYHVSRASVIDNISNNTSNDISNNSNTNIETELSSFSTKIYTPNDEARQNNIRITCSKLNGVVIKAGETFSFCGTVGKATPEAGYQKADIFDKNGNTIKGYGGRKLPN